MPEHVVEFGSVGRPPEPDGRLDAPAFHRNLAAIWSVLAPFLERRSGHVLEIGSGTGQHAAAFAPRRTSPGCRATRMTSTSSALRRGVPMQRLPTCVNRCASIC